MGTHIHEGTKGVAGPVVVPFTAPDVNGVSSGCTKSDAALMTRIMQAPETFYVNVHTSDFPAGVIRGQPMMVMDGGEGLAPAPAMLPNMGQGTDMRLVLVGCALLAVVIGLTLRLVAGDARTPSKHSEPPSGTGDGRANLVGRPDVPNAAGAALRRN